MAETSEWKLSGMVQVMLMSYTCTCQINEIFRYRLKISHAVIYTGWPRKKRMAYFLRYVDAITDISVWGNFSWDKWYQDHKFWFSSLFSREHFVRQCRDPKMPIIQPKCPFLLLNIKRTEKKILILFIICITISSIFTQSAFHRWYLPSVVWQHWNPSAFKK